MHKRIWITWEEQRRNIEIAKALPAKFFQFDLNGSRIKKYLVSGLKTIQTLKKEKPDVLFVQNPSIVLSLLAVFWKKLNKKVLVVDMHTFTLTLKGWKLKLLNFITRFIVRNSDFTIVTNEELTKNVKKLGGAPFILQDKMPEMKPTGDFEFKGRKNVVFISTFAEDEPYEEVIKSAEMIDKDICIYITGNYKKLPAELVDKSPENIIFTGFLPEDDFVNMLACADVIMDLTTKEACIVCGAYEATALQVPLITSKTKALCEYFNKGTVYTDNSATDIANSVMQALEENDFLRTDIGKLKDYRSDEWNLLRDDLLHKIDLKQDSGVPFLMYHSIADEGDNYSVTVENFLKQMQYLDNNNFNTISLNEFINRKHAKLPSNPILLTFDDGFADNFSIAEPILNAHGFKAVFFITSDLIDTDNYLTSSQVKKLHDAGHTIAAHGQTHRFLSDLDGVDIRNELINCTKKLSEITGTETKHLSLPGGRFSNNVLKIAEEYNFTSISNSEIHTNKFSADPYLMGRIAVRKNTSIKKFERMISDEKFLRKLKKQNDIKLMIMKILGNKFYHKIWKILYEK